MGPDTNAPLPPQTTVGGSQGTSYELLGRLAVGGMAELYLARTMGADGRETVVVLKRILPHLAEDPEFVRMFRDEAYLAATLQHPNIVRVYEIGRHGEDYFFTMEYVHGENLRAILRAAQKRNEPLPVQHMLTIALGVTSALHYAHEQADPHGNPLKIVHRDVSPTNVLVSYDGLVKIVDFGIAKAAAGTHVTQAGMLKGKASYMSPEQCRADPVDRRSDVFAIGILLYEMTTLTRLFRGDNELAILHQVLTGTVPLPSTRTDSYSPDLERVVMRALQNDPQQRYQTALELQNDLQQFAAAHRIQPSTVGLGQYLFALFGGKALPWAKGVVEPAASESATGIPTSAERVGFDGVDETEQTRHRDSRTPPGGPESGDGSQQPSQTGRTQPPDAGRVLGADAPMQPRSPSTPGRRGRAAPRSGSTPAVRPDAPVRPGPSGRPATGAAPAGRARAQPSKPVKISAPASEEDAPGAKGSPPSRSPTIPGKSLDLPPANPARGAAGRSGAPAGAKTIAPSNAPGGKAIAPPSAGAKPPASVGAKPPAIAKTVAPLNTPRTSGAAKTIAAPSLSKPPARTIAAPNVSGGAKTIAPQNVPAPAKPSSFGSGAQTVAPVNIPRPNLGPPASPNLPGSGFTAPASATVPASSSGKPSSMISESPVQTGATVAPGSYVYTPPAPQLDLPTSGVMQTQTSIQSEGVVSTTMPITGTPPRGSGTQPPLSRTAPPGSRTAPPGGRAPTPRTPTAMAPAPAPYQPPAPDYDPDEDALTQVAGNSKSGEVERAFLAAAVPQDEAIARLDRKHAATVRPPSQRETLAPLLDSPREQTQIAPAPTRPVGDHASGSESASEPAPPQDRTVIAPPPRAPAKTEFAPPPASFAPLSGKTEFAPQPAPFAPPAKTEFAPQSAPFARPSAKTEFAPQPAPFAPQSRPAAKTEFAPQPAPFAARDKTEFAPGSAASSEAPRYPPGYEPREQTQFAPAPTAPPSAEPHTLLPPLPPGPADSTLSPSDVTPPDGIPNTVLPIAGSRPASAPSPVASSPSPPPPPPPSTPTAAKRRPNRDTVFELPARPAALGGPPMRGGAQAAPPRSGAPLPRPQDASQPVSMDAELDLEDANTIPMQAETVERTVIARAPGPPVSSGPEAGRAGPTGTQWVERAQAGYTAPMPAVPLQESEPRSGGRGLMIGIVVAAIVLVPAGAFALWYFVFRDGGASTSVAAADPDDDAKGDAKAEGDAKEEGDAKADDGAAPADDGAAPADDGAAAPADDGAAAPADDGAAAPADDGAAAPADDGAAAPADDGAVAPADDGAAAPADDGAAAADDGAPAADDGAPAADDGAAADDGGAADDGASERPPDPSAKKGSSKAKGTTSSTKQGGAKKGTSKGTSAGGKTGGKAKKKGQTPFPGFGPGSHVPP